MGEQLTNSMPARTRSIRIDTVKYDAANKRRVWPIDATDPIYCRSTVARPLPEKIGSVLASIFPCLPHILPGAVVGNWSTSTATTGYTEYSCTVCSLCTVTASNPFVYYILLVRIYQPTDHREYTRSDLPDRRLSPAWTSGLGCRAAMWLVGWSSFPPRLVG